MCKQADGYQFTIHQKLCYPVFIEVLSDAGEALNIMWELLTQSDNNPGENQPACAPSDPGLQDGRFSLRHLQRKKLVCTFLL